MVDKKTLEKIEEIRNKYEFITFLLFDNNTLKVGIVQNETPKTMFFYDYEKLSNENEKIRFINFCDEWWWNSNQSIPIDSFIGKEFDHFIYTLSGFSKKSIQHIIGPTFSLTEKYLKRIKKKKIEIINILQ